LLNSHTDTHSDSDTLPDTNLYSHPNAHLPLVDAVLADTDTISNSDANSVSI